MGLEMQELEDVGIEEHVANSERERDPDHRIETGFSSSMGATHLEVWYMTNDTHGAVTLVVPDGEYADADPWAYEGHPRWEDILREYLEAMARPGDAGTVSAAESTARKLGLGALDLGP